MKKPTVTIIGGGFSGLTLAWQLLKLGVPVEIHETQSRWGGMIQSRTTDFGLVESAANGMMLSDLAVEMFSDIGFAPVLTQSASKKRFIFRDHPRRWPLNFVETLHLVFRVLGVLLRGKTSMAPKPGQSVAQWSEQHLSNAVTDNLLGPGLQGIYAGDVNKMSASLIFGRFFQGAPKKKTAVAKGLASGQRGMQELIDSLVEKIRFMGGGLHLQSSISSQHLLNLPGPLVIATSVKSAAELLLMKDPELSRQLQQIEVAPLVSVTTFWRRPPTKYRGFGILLPFRFRFQTLGLLMNSFIFPHRGRAHSETFILGGPLHPDVIKLSDGELMDLIQKERRLILKEDNELCHSVITRWSQGLPQYNVNLEKLLPQLQLPPNVFLHGNYLGSIGLTKILQSSKNLAERLHAELKKEIPT